MRGIEDITSEIEITEELLGELRELINEVEGTDPDYEEGLESMAEDYEEDLERLETELERACEVERKRDLEIARQDIGIWY